MTRAEIIEKYKSFIHERIWENSDPRDIAKSVSQMAGETIGESDIRVVRKKLLSGQKGYKTA